MKKLLAGVALLGIAFANPSYASDTYTKVLYENCWATITVAKILSEKDPTTPREVLADMEQARVAFFQAVPGTFEETDIKAFLGAAKMLYEEFYPTFVETMKKCNETYIEELAN